MRLSRVAPVLIAVFAAGCMHASVPNGAVAPSASHANLDSLAYERPMVVPAAAYAQAPASPKSQVRPRADAAPAVHAQAVPDQAVPVVVRSPVAPSYRLDTGDTLRIVVFGQDGLTNSYIVDAAGQVTMPLIGAVGARGLTTQQLTGAVAAKLRAGFIREPHVAIEVESYRPFFILGEVTLPGQYPYVPNMTVETAVAIAGGFTPRAYRNDADIDRPVPGGVLRSREPVSLFTQVLPGDTVVIKERWF
jgi:polysaccharide export outer membrane protein